MSNRDLVTKALADIRAEIAETERHLEDLRLQLRGAEALMSRLGRMRRAVADRAPAVESAPASTSPTDVPPVETVKEDRVGPRASGLADAVADVLRESPDGMTLQVIRAKVAENGRPLEYEQVRSAVNYLRRRGLAKRVRRGMWRLVIDATPETTEDPADFSSAGSSVLHIRPAPEGGEEDEPSARDRNDQVPRWNDGHHHHPSVVAEG